MTIRAKIPPNSPLSAHVAICEECRTNPLSVCSEAAGLILEHLKVHPDFLAACVPPQETEP